MMLYIALGAIAIQNGEILNRVKERILCYIDNDTLEKNRDTISYLEYKAMKDDLALLQQYLPDKLMIIPDFK